jgi:hypothetical protein
MTNAQKLDACNMRAVNVNHNLLQVTIGRAACVCMAERIKKFLKTSSHHECQPERFWMTIFGKLQNQMPASLQLLKSHFPPLRSSLLLQTICSVGKGRQKIYVYS